MSEDRVIERMEGRNAALRSSAGAVARNRKEVLGALLSTPEGRTFLWNELQTSYVYSATYVPGSFDGTAFNEGMRSKGLKLLVELQGQFPASFIQMTRENSSVQFQESETTDE